MRRAWLAGVAGAGLVLGACTESRVVRYNPVLGGLPGAESQTPVVRDFGEYQDPGEPERSELEEKQADGSIKLLAKNGKHLMNHIHNTLEADNKALFVSQVLSQITKRECLERGVDPGECFEFLQAHRADVDALFNRLPGGERTAGVYPRSLGGNVTRVQLGPRAEGDLKWGGFDMVMEKGNYRLRWFVPARQ